MAYSFKKLTLPVFLFLVFTGIILYGEWKSSYQHYEFTLAYRLACQEAALFDFDPQQFQKAIEINYRFYLWTEDSYLSSLICKGCHTPLQTLLLKKRNEEIRSLLNPEQQVIWDAALHE